MEITKSQWITALKLEGEFNRRSEHLSRRAIGDAMQVSDVTARFIKYALENRQIISLKPDTFDAVQFSKTLVLSDIHIPFDDRLCVETVLEFTRQYQPDSIIILGDLIDFFKISIFPEAKKPGKKSVKEELNAAKSFLSELRKEYLQAKIIYYEGNHEQRMDRYLLRNASEIYELIDNLIPVSLDLSSMNIEYLSQPFQIGKLWFLHSHEFRCWGNAEYVTNIVFRKLYDHFICGHWHRQQEKTWKRIDGNIFWGGVLGCLCQEMDYARINQWTRGFGTVDFAPDGTFRARLHKIYDGNIY